MTQETGVEMAEHEAGEALLSRYLEDEAAEAAEAEDTAEPGDAPEVDDEEVEAAGDDPDPADQEPDEGTEEAFFESVEELAEALEMSTDDLLSKIQIDAQVDGQSQKLTLKELQSGYQREADYTRKTQALAEERRTFEASVAAEQQSITQHHAELAALIQASEQSLMGEIQLVNWEQLRTDDPAEFAARSAELNTRANQINQLKQEGLQRWQAENQALQQKQAQVVQQQMQASNEALTRALPEWADETTRATQQKQIGEYLLANGYQAEELRELYDHRALLVARKAMLYDQMQKQSKDAKQKVKKLPKVLKPGRKASQKQRLSSKLKAKQTRLKKTGSVDDAAALLLERMG